LIAAAFAVRFWLANPEAYVDALHERGKSLEEQFFRKQNEKLLEELRGKKEAEGKRDALRQASGMTDDSVLTKLVEVGIGPDTMAAVSLVPLVIVAWADGTVQEKERVAILRGASAKGIHEGGPAYELLSQWLEHAPDAELFASWSDYIQALKKELSSEQMRILHEQVVERAHAVAEAAGGLLGVKRVSKAEEEALHRLEMVFLE
jgi:hypothetical protein